MDYQNAVSQYTGGQPVAQGLAAWTTEDLRKLKGNSARITVVGWLWAIGSGLVILGGVAAFAAALLSGERGEDFVFGMVAMLVLVVLGSINAAGAYGALKRPSWGRVVGMVLCALALFSIPVGTVIGIIGLIGFSGGEKLFGPDRINPEDLKAELARRGA